MEYVETESRGAVLDHLAAILDEASFGTLKTCLQGLVRDQLDPRCLFLAAHPFHLILVPLFARL